MLSHFCIGLNNLTIFAVRTQRNASQTETKGPIQLSCPDAAMSIGHALHPVVGEAVQKPPWHKEIVASLPLDCIVAVQALESWIGLDPTE